MHTASVLNPSAHRCRRPLPDERYPLGPPDEPLGRPLAVSRGLDGSAAYGAPLGTAVPDDPFGLRSTITPATSGPSLTVARPAVTGLEPQQVSLRHHPGSALVLVPNPSSAVCLRCCAAAAFW